MYTSSKLPLIQFQYYQYSRKFYNYHSDRYYSKLKQPWLNKFHVTEFEYKFPSYWNSNSRIYFLELDSLTNPLLVHET